MNFDAVGSGNETAAIHLRREAVQVVFVQLHLNHPSTVGANQKLTGSVSMTALHVLAQHELSGAGNTVNQSRVAEKIQRPVDGLRMQSFLLGGLKLLQQIVGSTRLTGLNQRFEQPAAAGGQP